MRIKASLSAIKKFQIFLKKIRHFMEITNIKKFTNEAKDIFI